MDNNTPMIYANKFIVAKNGDSGEVVLIVKQERPKFDDKDAFTSMSSEEQFTLVLNNKVAELLTKALSDVTTNNNTLTTIQVNDIKGNTDETV